MAAANVTEATGVSAAIGGGGGAAETWKRHIVRQLRNRDEKQHDTFQDLIRLYTRLLERTSLLLTCSTRLPSFDRSSASSLLLQNNQLKKVTGELAFQVVELQRQVKTKDDVLVAQKDRLQVGACQLAAALDDRQRLQRQVVLVQEENKAVKMEYDALLEQQCRAETSLREEKAREAHLLDDMIHPKQQAAARLNSRNERRSRTRDTNLQRELQTAARSKVTVDSSSGAPTCRPSSPKTPPTERRHARLFRSVSATSPRILTSIREMFEKRRGHSFGSLEEDQLCFGGLCLSARVPVRALQVLDAHEQGINAVRFSSSSALLATGGTDRVIKLWEVRAGSLTHRATLNGSTEGITCVEFDPTGLRILGASYDMSALLWRLDDSSPKLTLTGHSRKVTAARFSSVHQVVTGSADRTIRLWDLQRAACIQVVKVSSYCSDLVCCENCIISGHFDSRIRVWDTRASSCVQELPAAGKVTSLDISSDRRLLLSCCRDDCLQLADLRRRNNDRMCFRADGFTCGSDSTKAVISPDGCFLAAGSADGTVYIWNVSTGNLETRLPDKHSSSISAVSWAMSGEYVVSVDKSRRAVLWSDI
ncbi:ATG16 autophagy related 16-like 2 [Aulostomus maculatus]